MFAFIRVDTDSRIQTIHFFDVKLYWLKALHRISNDFHQITITKKHPISVV